MAAGSERSNAEKPAMVTECWNSQEHQQQPDNSSRVSLVTVINFGVFQW